MASPHTGFPNTQTELLRIETNWFNLYIQGKPFHPTRGDVAAAPGTGRGVGGGARSGFRACGVAYGRVDRDVLPGAEGAGALGRGGPDVSDLLRDAVV